MESPAPKKRRVDPREDLLPLVKDPIEDLFPFLSIPSRVQDKIFKKSDYCTIAALEGTCKDLSRKCEKLCPELHADYLEITQVEEGTAVILKVHDGADNIRFLQSNRTAPCQIFVQQVTLKTNAVTGDAIVAALQKHKITAEQLLVMKTDGGSLLRLVELLHLKTIDGGYVKSEYCNSEAFQNLESISCEENHSLREEDVHKLKASNIEFDCSPLMTVQLAHDLILAWKKNKREIEQIHLKETFFHPTEEAEEILKDCNASLVWSVTSHDDSQVAYVPYEELSDIDDISVYSVRRFENIHNPLVVVLTSSEVILTTRLDELGALEVHVMQELHRRTVNYG